MTGQSISSLYRYKVRYLVLHACVLLKTVTMHNVLACKVPNGQNDGSFYHEQKIYLTCFLCIVQCHKILSYIVVASCKEKMSVDNHTIDRLCK